MFDQDLFPVPNSGQSFSFASKTNPELMYNEAIYDLFPLPLYSRFNGGNVVYEVYGNFELFETEDLDGNPDEPFSYNIITSLN